MSDEITARKGSKLPAGWETWPTLTEAANLIGVSRKRLSEFVKLGVVKKHLAPNSKGSGIGSYRLNPDELAVLEDQIAEQDEAGTAAPSTADVVRESAASAKQAREHAERLITLLTDPLQQVMTALREENAALRVELGSMRKERAELHAQQETIRSAQALEQMALVELKGDQDTKREAIDLAKKILGPMALKHFGIVDPRAAALQEALALIPKDSFEVLFKMGVLPPEAEQKLKIGLDWKDPEPEAKPNADS